MTPKNSASIPRLSTNEFIGLGVGAVAYIRLVPVAGGAVVFEIHSADGQVLGNAPTADQARALLVQNDLEPLSVH